MNIDVEAAVRGAWFAVLDLSPDADAEHFFVAGGSSIDALQLMERVEAELRIEFPLETLFLSGELGAVIDECRRRYLAPADPGA